MPISGYLKSLREKVGHDPVFIPAVGALIFDGSGKLLLQRSSDDGQWQTVGGAMEPDEQPYAAVIREVLEETNLEVMPERIVEVFTRPPTIYPNGDVCIYLAIFFECSVVSGELAISDDESLELRFFDLEDLPEMTDVAKGPILRYRQQKGALYFDRSTKSSGQSPSHSNNI